MSININLSERKLSVIVHTLFSAWLLAFLFEGRILYSLMGDFNLHPGVMVFGGMAVHFAGLLLCGFLIKTKQGARRLFLFSYAFFIGASAVFFFPPSLLWALAMIMSAFLAGGCVAAWGFYFKSGTPKNERIKTAADVLIFSSILMIILNMTAMHLSPYVGLAFSMLMLSGALLFALRLPVGNPQPGFGPGSGAGSKSGAGFGSGSGNGSGAGFGSGSGNGSGAARGSGPAPGSPRQGENAASIMKPLAILCLFIVVITINSGLMYQVIKPAFAHLEWLTSWYWSIPYIVALFIMRNLPRQTNRAYILYIAIAMIGFSFIAFMSLDYSVRSYLVVNTLMLGAYGVYDLFWWSILGEMLDLHSNPARVFGTGLSANVLGVLLGGLLGHSLTSAGAQSPNATLLALAVVCITLVLLPPLHKHLSALLKDHAYLTVLYRMSAEDQDKAMNSFMGLGQLTGREREIASLLLKGKTYRVIAGELNVSENTVKTHVKNIYAKFKIQSRTELINIMLEQQQYLRQ